MHFRIITSVLKLVPEVASTYDYVLKPGFPAQNVAFDILREEAIEQGFLNIIEALSPAEQVKDK